VHALQLAQHDAPIAQLAQPARKSVIQFAPRGDIQIAPQIFIPDAPAGGSNMVSDDKICMAAMNEFENQELAAVANADSDV